MHANVLGQDTGTEYQGAACVSRTVKRVLVTGMPGAGKTSLLHEFAARGAPDELPGVLFIQGTTRAARAETLQYQRTVEPLLRASATLEVVTTVPVARVADIVLDHVL
jgi:KaiC/GvpD/RAD55 family RecA-like ATPase